MAIVNLRKLIELLSNAFKHSNILLHCPDNRRQR